MEILLRLADALQRQHDLIGELRAIASEFDNTVNDIETKTNELQRRFNLRAYSDPQANATPETMAMNMAASEFAAAQFANVVPIPAAESPFDIPSQFKNGPLRRGD